MLMVARDRPYSELRDALKGKKVVVWTCNTCARLCFEIGGTDSAERIAAALRNDGIDIIGVLHTGASCLEGKLRQKYDPEMFGKADIVLSLTCNIGALCAERVFGKEVINPVATLGVGFVDLDRRLMVCSDSGGGLSVRGLTETAEEKGLWCDPYV